MEIGTDIGWCRNLSPDGAVLCTRMAVHLVEGPIACRNAATDQSWCGRCDQWSCSKHNIEGQDQRRKQ